MILCDTTRPDAPIVKRTLKLPCTLVCLGRMAPDFGGDLARIGFMVGLGLLGFRLAWASCAPIVGEGLLAAADASSLSLA